MRTLDHIPPHRPSAANDATFPPVWRAGPGSARGHAIARLRLAAARFAPGAAGREARLPKRVAGGVAAPVLRAGAWSVPTSAFVAIGGLDARNGSANDNRPKPGSPGARPLWRDLLVLVLLAVTVAGAFYSGRLHGETKVIVVPGPSSSRSVVT